jgi:hypothetical protein
LCKQSARKANCGAKKFLRLSKKRGGIGLLKKNDGKEGICSLKPDPEEEAGKRRGILSSKG